MGTEKRIREIHDYAKLQLEGLLSIRPPHSPAKYHQADKWQPESAPDIYCGQKCVVRATGNGFKGDVLGYLLCRVISWAKRESLWTSHTVIYLVPEQSSSEALDDRIGVITHANYHPKRTVYWNGGQEIISFDIADMPRRAKAA